MKLFKKTLAALATIGAMTAAGSANATLTNWYLDSDGVGGNAAVQVADYVDLSGQSYVHNTFTGPTTFGFQEAGFFNSFSVDGINALNPILNSTFSGIGSGTTGGLLTFSDGTLTIKSGATTIGIFDLQTGSANLNTNSTLPNGPVSLIFKATMLAAGYFFDSSMLDLSAVVSNPDGLLFGFATTDAIPMTAAIGGTLAGLYNAAFDPDVAATLLPNGTTELHISNNGQFRLEVPEPASLALTGLALLGLGALRRRRDAK